MTRPNHDAGPPATGGPISDYGVIAIKLKMRGVLLFFWRCAAAAAAAVGRAAVEAERPGTAGAGTHGDMYGCLLGGTRRI